MARFFIHAVRVPEEAVPPQKIVLRWHVLMGSELQVGFPPRRFVLATQNFLWRIGVLELFQPQIANLPE